MKKEALYELPERIIDVAFKLSKPLGSGFLEKICKILFCVHPFYSFLISLIVAQISEILLLTAVAAQQRWDFLILACRFLVGGRRSLF